MPPKACRSDHPSGTEATPEAADRQPVVHRFVDCRFDLADRDRGRAEYWSGHVPGAAFMDLETQLSGTKTGENGRHPLPAAEDFARDASAAGIGDGVMVTAYDDGSDAGAARMWWLLRHFGHRDCAVLSGGLGRWVGPLQAGPEICSPATFQPATRSADTIEADELLDRLGDPGLAVIDARAPERYRGEQEPIDPVAGHIPGAVNVPFTGDLTFGEDVLNAEEIAVYCGSGVSACVVLFALARLGREDARLYPGSWSEWASRTLPVAR